jgi:hypothetical protein
MTDLLLINIDGIAGRERFSMILPEMSVIPQEIKNTGIQEIPKRILIAGFFCEHVTDMRKTIKRIRKINFNKLAAIIKQYPIGTYPY